MKKGVATVEATMEVPPQLEDVSLQEIDDALCKAKVTYEAAAIGVTSGFATIPLAVVHPGEESSTEGHVAVPPPTEGSASTVPSTSKIVTVEKEGPPVVDIIDISSDFERTPS